MSEINLIRQLEDTLNIELEEVPEARFKLRFTDSKSNFVKDNAYALSDDGDLIGLFLRNIAGNKIANLSFQEYQALIHLHLVNINLPSYGFLQSLKKLQTLVLYNNKLTDVTFLQKLTNLTSLNLRSNKLTDVTFLQKLTNLTSLNLSRNKLTDVTFLQKLTNLTSLNLSDNKLTDVTFLQKLTNLTSLYLSGNNLTDVTFPQELTNLTSLNLSGNNLTDVTFPQELTNLTSLDLGGNNLTDVTFLQELTNLTSLYLSGNNLTDVTFLQKLTNLTSLYLSGNKLTDVTFLQKLTNLTSLDLRGNKLTDVTFPKELTNLTSLDLSWNQIKEIPVWLAEKGLDIKIEDEYAFSCINLYGNPIEEPPLEVVKQGNTAILNYYFQLETQGKDYLYEAKMLIVGEGESGKTTLAHKIEDKNCFLPTIDDRTKGITINTHSFPVRAKNNAENRQFNLNVWDFGGQEIYHATHRFFLSKRSLYVLVADNRKDDTDFNYWLNIIELFAGESPIIIVLNEKEDLQRSINTSELRSRYPESIKEVVPVNFKTQEETDNHKRQQRLKKIGELISHIEHYANNLPHIGEPIPARWVDVREAVETDTRNYIYREQFDEICHKLDITKPEDIVTLLGYFHDIGIILHFAENPLLSSRVILKPTWATNAVYRIFDNDIIKAKEGRFSRSDCANLWRDKQYNYMQQVLIELMKNFRLVYEIGNTDNLVAPQMLPKDTPNYTWDDSINNSLMQFRYDFFMPKGILWQFIVIVYRYIENHDWVWRNGVILQRNGTQAEVIENLFERRIYIRFSGTNIAEFRAIIADKLDEISKSYYKLAYEKMIPCNCSVCLESSEPHFFKYSRLKTRQEKGRKQTIECEISEEDVLITPLLEGFGKPIPKEPQLTVTKPKPKPDQKMRTIKIFLASSSELNDDREQFEIFINRKNKEYIKREIFLELVLWEDFIDAMSQTRLQNEYNKAITDCDIFVSLFHTKVGQYTAEEFAEAFKTFKANNKPLIYTYFKDAEINMSQIKRDDFLSLDNFKQKLSNLGHFYTTYTNIDQLKYKFTNQLSKLLTSS